MKKGTLIIVAVCLLIVGIFAYKTFKKKPDETGTNPGGSTGGGGSSYTPNSNTYPIKSGQSGELVKQLQNRLNAKGFNLASDGLYGPKTREAVKSTFGGDGSQVTQAQFDSLSPGKTIVGGLTIKYDPVQFATAYDRAYNTAFDRATTVVNSAMVALFDFLLTLPDDVIMEYNNTIYKLYDFKRKHVYSVVKFLQPANDKEAEIINRAKLKFKALWPNY